MAKKKIEVKEAKIVEEPVEEVQEHVVFHLDVDPNDPRNAIPAGKLSDENR